MDADRLRKGYRNAWIITLLSLVFIVAATALTLWLHTPEPAVTWDMGGKSFVPAASQYGEGYHQEAGEQPWTRNRREATP